MFAGWKVHLTADENMKIIFVCTQYMFKMKKHSESTSSD